ncbi:hydrolase CocE/NonD family protein, partial [Aureobasidium melanogenum]
MAAASYSPTGGTGGAAVMKGVTTRASRSVGEHVGRGPGASGAILTMIECDIDTNGRSRTAVHLLRLIRLQRVREVASGGKRLAPRVCAFMALAMLGFGKAVRTALLATFELFRAWACKPACKLLSVLAGRPQSRLTLNTLTVAHVGASNIRSESRHECRAIGTVIYKRLSIHDKLRGSGYLDRVPWAGRWIRLCGVCHGRFSDKLIIRVSQVPESASFFEELLNIIMSKLRWRLACIYKLLKEAQELCTRMTHDKATEGTTTTNNKDHLTLEKKRAKKKLSLLWFAVMYKHNVLLCRCVRLLDYRNVFEREGGWMDPAGPLGRLKRPGQANCGTRGCGVVGDGRCPSLSAGSTPRKTTATVMTKYIERLGLDVEYVPTNPLSDQQPPAAELNTHTEILAKGSVHGKGSFPLPCDIIADYDQPLVMRDGVKLYADVYRPRVNAKVPAIMVYTPYCKRGGWWNSNLNPVMFGADPASLSGLQAFESPDPGWWCDQDYAIVYVDAAGTSHSEGDQPFMGTELAERGYDAIEEIAKMNWCTGAVAMSGNSQLAMAQWAIGALNPPHLKAIAPWEGLIDLYREQAVRGGIPDRDFLDKAIFCFLYGTTRSDNLSKNSIRHPLLNAYWEDKRAVLEQIQMPAYLTASWTSPIHGKGTVSAFRRLGSKQKWLRVHNTQEWLDIADHDNARDLKRFFDRFLKGINNDWEATSPVRLSILNPGGADRVGRAESAWPLERQQFQKFYLDTAQGKLTIEPVKTASVTAYDSQDVKSSARFVFEAERRR